MSDELTSLTEVFDRQTRERFIPVSRRDVVRGLVEQSHRLPAEDREGFERFVELYVAVLRHRYQDLFENLKRTYAPFSPDQEFVQFDTPSVQTEQEFLTDINQLLERTNYEALPDEQLRSLVSGQTPSAFGLAMGVDIDQDYEYIKVYYRGRSKLRVESSRWFGLRKPREQVIEAFQRIVILLKRKGEQRIVVKTFRQVPVSDVAMVFPTTVVRMNWRDRLLLFSTGFVSLVGVAIRFISGDAKLISHSGLLVAGVLISAFVKVLFGYFRKQRDYRDMVFRQLYFKNLANNLGVISLVIAQAEEEETKEAVLAWYFLRASRTPMTASALDTMVENYLLETYNFSTDFELEDALRKLRIDKLLVDCGNGCFTARSAVESYALLDEYWDGVFSSKLQSHEQLSVG